MECKFIRNDKFYFSGKECSIHEINGEIFALSFVDVNMWPDMNNMIEVWIELDGDFIAYSVVRGETLEEGLRNYIKKEYKVCDE